MGNLEETIAQSLTKNFSAKLLNYSYLKGLAILEIMTCLRDVYNSLVYRKFAGLNIKNEVNDEVSEERVKEVIADIEKDSDAYLMVCHDTFEDTIAALYIGLVFFSVKWFKAVPSVGYGECDSFDLEKTLDKISQEIMGIEFLSDVESVMWMVRKLFNDCYKGTIDLDWFVQLRLKAYENNVIAFNG